MHDIRAIRENPAAFAQSLARRGGSLDKWKLDIKQILDADEAWLLASQNTQMFQQQINFHSKAAGIAKQSNDDASFLLQQQEVARAKREMAGQDVDAKRELEFRTTLISRLPNIPLGENEVPTGKNETENKQITGWGNRRNFDFPPKEHFEIKGVMPGMNFETAAKLSGSRFVVLTGAIARAHRALAQFMLDTHVDEHGLIETWTPVLVTGKTMSDAAILKTPMGGTGQLPKFREDLYQCSSEGWRTENLRTVTENYVTPIAIKDVVNGKRTLFNVLEEAFEKAPTNEEYWLIPTAEVTLTNTVAGEIVDQAALPLRLTAHTQCFRSEAGSAGKDTAGMLRQHQFEKVEMVTICTPDTALAEHDRMTRCAEAILEKLDIPYRTIVLCTGDMGFGAQKTHDLEAWLPGQNKFREISSVSTCGTFQARRMNARFKSAGGKPDYVATLNGSGLAVGRCLIAVLENGQQQDGSVDLPAVLHPYLGGKTRISAYGVLE